MTMPNLDEIKARRARLEWDSNKSMYDAYWDKHHFNKYAPADMDWLIAEVERLKAEKAQAEAERDVLITFLNNARREEQARAESGDYPAMCPNAVLMTPNGDFDWLKYAQQQAEEKGV